MKINGRDCLTAPANLPPMLCGLNEPGSSPVPIEDDPCKDLPKIAFHFAQEKYDLYIDSIRNVFDSAYRNKCLAAKNLESFTVTYSNSEYHYTLYYYDQAGNLVKTVPPAGVHKLSGSDLTTVKNYRANVLNGQAETGNVLVPAHTLVTQYRYNTLNQVVAQVTPDAGVSKFWYDRLGRLAVSQNAKQATANNYSYTLYDELGRIKEVGQLNNAIAITQSISQNGDDATIIGSLANWLNNKPAEQITRTFYDKSYIDGQGTLCPQYLCQQNLRNRVSYTAVYNTGTVGVLNEHTAATYYSYDIQGNVYELLQDYGSSANVPNAMNTTGNRFKKIEYKYDLISGKVNEVAYQADQPDAFYHRYSYDAENRLTLVETSHDKLVWEKDARYNYYRHGPLARTVLGELQVQGLDYIYTLQGWLKGVNSTSVNDGTYDIGQDGKIGSPNSLVARDVFGFSLNYFTNDYKPVGGSALNTFIGNTFSLTNADGNKTANPLYNGNIAAMLVNIPKIGGAQLYGYKYDQLNRIKSMDAFSGLNNANNTFSPVTIQNYKERITYDANGNIKTYKRNGDAARLNMDDMTYSYKPNTNQLDKVTDAAPDAAASEYDKYNDIKQGQQNGNYQYDAIGNLISDASEGITNIGWNVYGKISSITKTNGTVISYSYDAAGCRISKIIGNKSTCYVRDAGGNVMSVYVKEPGINNGDLSKTEAHIYGSSRLGMGTRIVNVEHPVATTDFERGWKLYEGNNQLGNVLVTFSDKTILHSTNGIDIDYYNADIASANDYYPGGMPMPGRKYSIENYAYGFNGKRKDNEMHGEGNVYDFGSRIYDPRVVTWYSPDPKASKHPFESPYVYVSNNPIIYIDPDGEEKIVVVGGGDITGNDKMKFINSGLLQVKNYANSIKNSNSDETVTVLLNMKFVSGKQYQAMQKAMKAIERETGVKVNMIGTPDGQSTTNYINSKTVERGILSDARTNDQITDMSFFGHGYRGEYTGNGTVKYDASTKKLSIEGISSFEPGHGTFGEPMNGNPDNRPEHKNWSWGAAQAQTINSKAFANSSSIVFYSCNAATPNASGESIVQNVSALVPQATVSGSKGLTSYDFIYTGATFSDKVSRWWNNGVGPSNELPKPTTQDHGNGVAEWHTYKKGVKQ